MRRTLCVLLLGTCAGWFATAQNAPGSAKEQQIEGVWVRDVVRPDGQNLKQIKLIASGHFMWVTYQNGKPIHSGGGTYTVDGDTYTEHADFISTVKELAGKDLPLKIQWQGEDFTQTGQMPNGKTFSETWKRLE